MINTLDFHQPRSEVFTLTINTIKGLKSKSLFINQDPFELQVNHHSKRSREFTG